MDLEIAALMLAVGLALVPIGRVLQARLRAALILCWVGVWLAVTPGIALYRSTHVVVEPDNRPVQRLRDEYVSSEECGACHPGEHDTWKHSWHRTMTQVASPEAIFGDFDDVQLEVHGWTTYLERSGDKFFALIFDWERKQYVRYEIVLVTGSHHMQIYWYSRGPDLPLGGVPFLYLKEDQKWIPIEAAFIQPPSSTPKNTVGMWNEVCIQCHTTRGRPGVADTGSEVRSDAVEFGIACEACHGPGEVHARANRGNPTRRYRKHLTEGADDTIVNPARLTKERSAETCGQCHGISVALPEDEAKMRQHGWNYRAGDVLDETGRLILRGGENYLYPPSAEATKLHNELFWSDGMVRVSGREVNGLYDSACFESGEMTCVSCHRLHKSDEDSRTDSQWANDQLESGMETDRACLQCHTTFAKNVEAHTHHGAESTGSQCMNCHMPYTTWGLMKGIRQHTVDSPTVLSSLKTGRPNACNACHIDETLEWTADGLASWYGQPLPEFTEDERTVAASLLWLLKGDAGQRALASWYLGWEPAQAVAGTDWIAPQLAPLLNDPYDVVRYAAARSLRSLPGFERFAYDFVGAKATREPAVQEVWAQYKAQKKPQARFERLLLHSDGSLDRVGLRKLLEQRDDRDVTLLE